MAALLRRLAARDGLPPFEEAEAVERAGYGSAVDLLGEEPAVVAQRSGVGEARVRELQRAAALLRRGRARTAAAMYDGMHEESAMFSCGCDGFDRLLGGGLLTGELYEVVGPSASGKTQLALFAAAHVAATSDASVVFVDTSHSFSAARVLEMRAEWARDDPHVRSERETLSTIRCVKAFSAVALLAALDNVRRQLDAQEGGFASALRLVVVDCASAVVAPVLGGGRPDGHALMAHAARLMKATAARHGVAFLITCHSVSGRGPGGGSKPALGESWSYAADTRVALEPGGHAVLARSHRGPVGASLRFRVGPAGVSCV